MTNQRVMKVAMRQSAVDMNCSETDFLKQENVLVRSAANEGARK